jgi:hypothetical protein
MEYVSIIVQEDAAHNLIDEVGEAGIMQFTDVMLYLSSFIYLGIMHKHIFRCNYV